MGHKLSRVDAMREMCIQCMGTRENPGYQNLINTCTSFKCPLHPFIKAQKANIKRKQGEIR